MVIKGEHKKILQKVNHSISIAEAMNSCLWLGDKDHKTIYVNPVYENLSGYSLQECIGQPADFCFDQESRRIITRQHSLRYEKVASQYEATMLSKTGEKIPLLISGAPTETGGTIGIFIDLRPLKKLHKREKLSQQIIKSSNEAIVVVGSTGIIKLWNNGATKIFGLTAEDVVGTPLSDIYQNTPGLEKSQKEISEELERKSFVHNLEIKRTRKDGQEVHLSMSIRKVTDDEEKLIGYITMFQDISMQKEADDQLQNRFDAMQDAYKELGLQRRQNDYINEIISSATSKDNLECLEKLIVSAVCMLTKCDAAILRLFDEEKQTLVLSQCLGVNPKWWDKHKISFKNSLAEECFKKKRPVIINNIEKSNKHQGTNLIRLHDFKTLILVPLYIGKKIIGSLSLYSTEPNKFRFIETDFIDKFGKQCSIAINAKL